ncbi:hypothetical protein SAMN03097708_01718 [Thiohalomonas denitrificans]|uniref:Uncharacterized protein n=1 Tax=Thiohalomonas denitrificans TaxID=415747 RepID=A0A1G5Q9V7_9GAMM|nr:hypothetical protein SAMN03097708_01718 [Thiohalomonas denitrificans]
MDERTVPEKHRPGIKSLAPFVGGSALALYGMSRSTRRVPFALTGLVLTFYGIMHRARRERR